MEYLTTILTWAGEHPFLFCISILVISGVAKAAFTETRRLVRPDPEKVVINQPGATHADEDDDEGCTCRRCKAGA